MAIRIMTAIQSDDLVRQISLELDHDQIVKMIADLDAACADWDVTQRLHQHFTNEMEKLAAEDAAEQNPAGNGG